MNSCVRLSLRVGLVCPAKQNEIYLHMIIGAGSRGSLLGPTKQTAVVIPAVNVIPVVAV